MRRKSRPDVIAPTMPQIFLLVTNRAPLMPNTMDMITVIDEATTAAPEMVNTKTDQNSCDPPVSLTCRERTASLMEVRDSMSTNWDPMIVTITATSRNITPMTHQNSDAAFIFWSKLRSSRS